MLPIDSRHRPGIDRHLTIFSLIRVTSMDELRRGESMPESDTGGAAASDHIKQYRSNCIQPYSWHGQCLKSSRRRMPSISRDSTDASSTIRYLPAWKKVDHRWKLTAELWTGQRLTRMRNTRKTYSTRESQVPLMTWLCTVRQSVREQTIKFRSMVSFVVHAPFSRYWDPKCLREAVPVVSDLYLRALIYCITQKADICRKPLSRFEEPENLTGC